MTVSFGRWFNFDGFRANGWKDEPLHCCYLGKVFFVWSHRNAWWATDSNRYPAEAFFPTLDAAKMAVEGMRTQGSQWHIEELPALVAAAQTNCLAVTEINTADPLADLVDTDADLRSLEKAANALRPSRKNSVIRIASEPKLLAPAHLPFRTHRPRSHGPRRVPLSWRVEISMIDLGPVLALVGSVTEQLQRPTDRSSPDGGLA